MTGVTIDHLISTTAFIAAIVLFTGLFAQTLQTAILYQQNRHVALKASDILDSILLSPGYPENWGASTVTPSCFGLHQSGSSSYVLHSFALMRLLSNAGEQVYYNVTGEWYSNISWGQNGGYLLLPISDTVSYATAAELLGVNQSYGFQLSVSQTLTVEISEIQLNPLKLQVEVAGAGFPLSSADINYNLFWVVGVDPDDGTPIFNYTSGSAVADETGKAVLDFSTSPTVDGSGAYTILVDTHLLGLSGIGFKSRETITKAGNIIPFVESFANRTVLLAHKWGKNDPDENQGALHFSAAFFALTSDFEPIEMDMANSTGVVNYGKGKPFHRLELPQVTAGFLVVSYRSGNDYGMVIMPWGIGTLGMSISFGGSPIGNVWVATDFRQVIVSGVAYQAKIACWSLKGYQIWKLGGWG